MSNSVIFKFRQPSFWLWLRSRVLDWKSLCYCRFFTLFISFPKKKWMPLLEQPQTLGGTASASLKMIALCFLLFSLLSIPKLTPASCHAECEFYLKSVMLVKFLISALSHGWESYGLDFSTRFPLAAVGHQGEYCCSASPFSCTFSCSTPADTLRPAP